MDRRVPGMRQPSDGIPQAQPAFGVDGREQPDVCVFVKASSCVFVFVVSSWSR
jgi:hypothetical protein